MHDIASLTGVIRDDQLRANTLGQWFSTFFAYRPLLSAKFFQCPLLVIQYTLANPNRGVSIKKKSVPISEFVRISEVIHLYGEFCSESL